MERLRVLELYSGIGGMHQALRGTHLLPLPPGRFWGATTPPSRRFRERGGDVAGGDAATAMETEVVSWLGLLPGLQTLRFAW